MNHDVCFSIWALCSRKKANYLKKLNLYLYAKNVLNIKICLEIILTQFLFFFGSLLLFYCKSPFHHSLFLLLFFKLYCFFCHFFDLYYFFYYFFTSSHFFLSLFHSLHFFLYYFFNSYHFFH